MAIALDQTNLTKTQYVQRILTETTSSSMKFQALALTMGQDGQPMHCGRNFRLFFDHAGRLVSSEEDYLALIEANRGEHKSMYYDDEEGATKFYRLCHRLKFTNPRAFKTRDTIERVGRRSDCSAQWARKRDTRPNGMDSRSNRILRSDVLIIDEVQDLDHHVLRLCLVLHRGSVGDVAILGDNEQTLDLNEFNWEKVLARLHSDFTRERGSLSREA